MTTHSYFFTHKGEGKCPEHYLSLYSLWNGEMVATLSFSISIKIGDFLVRIYFSFYSLTHNKNWIWGYPNLFLFLFSISIRKGDFLLPLVYQLSVPILYHIYKSLSSDLNTFFKNYLYYFLYSLWRGDFLYSILLLIKERGFPYPNCLLLNHLRFAVLCLFIKSLL